LPAVENVQNINFTKMKPIKLYFLSILLAVFFEYLSGQGFNPSLTFLNGRVGDIALRDSVSKINYTLVQSSLQGNFFVNTYEIYPGCYLDVLFQSTEYISGIETGCRNIVVGNNIHAGLCTGEIKKQDTAFMLGLGKEFGFVKFDSACFCTIHLLLGEKCMTKFWNSYNLNPHRSTMDEYLDSEDSIQKIRIMIIEKHNK
jgi:hypothetical protein